MKNNSKDQSRLIRFLGGTTSYYVLGLLIMLALVIYFFQQIGLFLTFFCDFATTLAQYYLR